MCECEMRSRKLCCYAISTNFVTTITNGPQNHSRSGDLQRWCFILISIINVSRASESIRPGCSIDMLWSFAHVFSHISTRTNGME